MVVGYMQPYNPTQASKGPDSGSSPEGASKERIVDPLQWQPACERTAVTPQQRPARDPIAVPLQQTLYWIAVSSQSPLQQESRRPTTVF
jgi:hypothetical protein